MLTLILGENAYERDQILRRMTRDYQGAVERFDGSAVTVGDLHSLLYSQSLFSDQRLIIINNLSDNKDVWQEFGQYLDKESDAEVVLVEPKPDKRTKTYKSLTKVAKVIECAPLSEHDSAKATAWLTQLAVEKDIELAKEAARQMVVRLGTDQYILSNELVRLSSLGAITPAVVAEYSEETIHDTAFSLLELAIEGQVQATMRKVQRLRVSEDAYQTFGLLVSQVFALAVVSASKASDDLRDTGVHPFVLRKLRPLGERLSVAKVRALVHECAQTDTQLKGSVTDPWLLIETMLLRIARLE